MSDIDTVSVAYEEMALEWHLPKTLMGGTKAMRKAQELYLPKEAKETKHKYEIRLNRSFLTNKFKDAVMGLAGQVFSRDVVVANASETIESIIEDVDMCGFSLSRFAKNLFMTGEVFGLTHILVDMPVVGEGNLTLADQRNLGIRPYFIEIKPDKLIAWKFEGNELVHIRYKESIIVEEDYYEDKVVDQIRIIEKIGEGSYFWVYQQNDSTEWELIEEGSRTYPGVGLATVYLNKTGELQGQCALNELAWLNLAHWQSDSDQKNILHTVRVPRLFAKNLGAEGVKSIIDHGVHEIIVSESDNGDARWMEHNGNAIESGERDLEKLEREMAKHSLEPMVPKTGTQTATAKAIDTSKGNSSLSDWAQGIENGIINALRIADRWMGTESPELVVDVNKDFNISLTASEDFKDLMDLNARGKISDQTLLKEAKRLNKISDDIDIELELETIANSSFSNLPALVDEDEEENQGN